MAKRFLIAFFTTIFIVGFVSAIIIVENNSNSIIQNSQGEFYIQKTDSFYKYYLHLKDNTYEITLPDVKKYVNKLKGGVKYIEPIAPRTVSLVRYIKKRVNTD